MNKTELVAAMAEKAELSKKDAESALKAFVDVVTDELKKEGYVREILSKVQNMRKDKGFEVLDNINLYISGNAMLEEVIKQNAELIKHDTLTINIIYNQDRKEYTETNINGETLNIDVEVVNK